jgi:periplasmic divalent cation tolerance protein
MNRVDYLSVTTTVDSREAADRIAFALLEGRLAACVQIEGPLESLYHWRGALERALEWRCTIKTRADLFERLEVALRALHPYDTPEILAHAIERGGASYLAWIDEKTAP